MYVVRNEAMVRTKRAQLSKYRTVIILSFHVLKILKVSGLGSKDVRGCCGRFSFVANSKLLLTCSFGTCSALQSVYQTRPRIQYDDYILPNTRYDQKMHRNMTQWALLRIISIQKTKKRVQRIHTTTQSLAGDDLEDSNRASDIKIQTNRSLSGHKRYCKHTFFEKDAPVLHSQNETSPL